MGGVIPKRDIPTLKSYGIADVCVFSTPLDEIVECVSKAARGAKNN